MVAEALTAAVRLARKAVSMSTLPACAGGMQRRGWKGSGLAARRAALWGSMPPHLPPYVPLPAHQRGFDLTQGVKHLVGGVKQLALWGGRGCRMEGR